MEAVDATLGPQLGITDDMLDSSPPANKSNISSGSGTRLTKVFSSPDFNDPGRTRAFLSSDTDFWILACRCSFTSFLVQSRHKPESPAIVTAI